MTSVTVTHKLLVVKVKSSLHSTQRVASPSSTHAQFSKRLTLSTILSTQVITPRPPASYLAKESHVLQIGRSAEVFPLI